MSVLVVGSVALDSLETPFGKRDDALGGSATYFSTAASLLTSVRLVAVIGEDFPENHVEMLRQKKVDLAGLTRVKGGKTFRWKGRYHDNMNDRTTLATDLNVFEHFVPKLPPAFRGSEYLFLANIQPGLQEQVFRQMQGPRLVGLDTMNLWISIANPELLSVLRHVDVLTLNDEEARQLTGEHNLVKAARGVQKLGPKNVVVKRGESGALLFDHAGDVFAAPALPLEEVTDPTGAGDSFAGGFMGFIQRHLQPGELDGGTVRRAMICGSTMASFCCEDFSLHRFVSLDDKSIDERFRAFRHLTHFDELRL